MSFFFPYPGSKRRELKRINMPKCVEAIDIVVEPFCGSCCFSMASGKDAAVNDLDPMLFDFMSTIQAEGDQKFIDFYNAHKTREQFEEVLAGEQNLMAWYYKRAASVFRVGMYPTARPPVRRVSLSKAVEFFQKSRITNVNYADILTEFHDNERALIFLDPPYFNSSSVEYYQQHGALLRDQIEGDRGVRVPDNTQMFVDIIKFFQTCRCKFIMITNGNAIMKHIYRDFIIYEYQFKYSGTIIINGIGRKKLTTHLLISNLPPDCFNCHADALGEMAPT